jgi:transposase
LAEALGDRARARILIEASTESEWVARGLEGLGHEVIVADPNFARLYATRQRKVKTDRRDVPALAEACVLGAYRRAHVNGRPRRATQGRPIWSQCGGVTRPRAYRLSPLLLGSGPATS